MKKNITHSKGIKVSVVECVTAVLLERGGMQIV